MVVPPQSQEADDLYFGVEGDERLQVGLLTGVTLDGQGLRGPPYRRDDLIMEDERLRGPRYGSDRHIWEDERERERGIAR